MFVFAPRFIQMLALVSFTFAIVLILNLFLNWFVSLYFAYSPCKWFVVTLYVCFVVLCISKVSFVWLSVWLICFLFLPRSVSIHIRTIQLAIIVGRFRLINSCFVALLSIQFSLCVHYSRCC